MDKKTFESQLFRRKIHSDDRDFWSYFVAECLYRLEDKNMKECTCMEHSMQRQRLETALKKALKLLDVKY